MTAGIKKSREQWAAIQKKSVRPFMELIFSLDQSLAKAGIESGKLLDLVFAADDLRYTPTLNDWKKKKAKLSTLTGGIRRSHSKAKTLKKQITRQLSSEIDKTEKRLKALRKEQPGALRTMDRMIKVLEIKPAKAVKKGKN